MAGPGGRFVRQLRRRDHGPHNSSHWKPHQNRREMARRLKQAVLGTITADNGLTEGGERVADAIRTEARMAAAGLVTPEPQLVDAHGKRVEPTRAPDSRALLEKAAKRAKVKL